MCDCSGKIDRNNGTLHRKLTISKAIKVFEEPGINVEALDLHSECSAVSED